MSSWSGFFKDAGIPSPLAEKYSTLFEDNRITRDMLSDLNKDILHDIGIIVVGDIIAILKHAKKTQLQTDLKSTSAANFRSKKVVATPLSAIPTETLKLEKALPMLSSDTDSTTTTKNNDQKPVVKITEVATLHSDQILIHDADPLLHEEYTTSTYEAKMKRKASQPSPVKLLKTSPSNKPVTVNRVVSLPLSKDEGSNGSGGIQRSKRFLEAAGCFQRKLNDKIPTTSKSSVFSRLELPLTAMDTDRTTFMSGRSGVRSRLGKRAGDELMSSPSSVSKTAGLYSDEQNVNASPGTTIYSRLGEKEEMSNVGSDICTPTMVADTFSKHSDVHARLKKKGMTVLGTRGPLGKRLGEHAVFTRLG